MVFYFIAEWLTVFVPLEGNAVDSTFQVLLYITVCNEKPKKKRKGQK